jgi:hypothetical protein
MLALMTRGCCWPASTAPAKSRFRVKAEVRQPGRPPPIGMASSGPDGRVRSVVGVATPDGRERAPGRCSQTVDVRSGLRVFLRRSRLELE